MSKKRLGRGLGALLSDAASSDATSGQTEQATAPETKAPAPEQTAPQAATDSGITMIQLDTVVPSPYQPRRYFDEEALADLSQYYDQAREFARLMTEKSMKSLVHTM